MKKNTQSGVRKQRVEQEPVIAFRCPRELKIQAYVRAAQEEIPIQELCIRALKAYLLTYKEAA